MTSKENNDIIFYGERGIINSIVLDIKDDIGKGIDLLKLIKYAHSNSSIKPFDEESIKSIRYIVEMSLSQFGSPDLIIIAEMHNEKKYIFFVEAKLCSYIDSSISCVGLKSFQNNASKLNVQLALKYRFVKALSPDNHTLIQENEKSPYEERKRKIVNMGVLNMIKENFQNVIEYFFIALTNDNNYNNPLEESSFQPPLNDKDDWENDKGRFGILTYSSLEENEIISRKNGYYSQAVKILGQPPQKSAEFQNVEVIQTKNIRGWTEGQEEIANCYMEKLKKDVFYCKFIKNNGSYSIEHNGFIIAKIYVQANENKNIVNISLKDDGLLPSTNLNEYKEKYVKLGVKKRIFLNYSINNFEKDLYNQLIEFIERH